MHATTPLIDFYEGSYRPTNLRGASPLTDEEYRLVIGVLERWWRSQALPERQERQLPVLALTDELVGQYLLSRSELSPATRNKHLRMLCALSVLACLKGLVPAAITLEREQEFTRKPRCWSMEELDRLLQAAMTLNDAHQKRILRYRRGRIGEVPAKYWWAALILLIYNCGVRISAIMSIRSEDLDLERGTVLIRAEAQKDREDQQFTLLPVTISALSILKPQRLTRVFEEWPYDRAKATREHRKHRWGTLIKHLTKLLATAGLPTTRRDKFHKLRRTFVTQVARKKGIAVAQSLAGHSTAEVTKLYIDERFMETPSVAEILSEPKLEFQLTLIKPDDASAKAG